MTIYASGINQPFDSDNSIISNAILDSGAYSSYVNNRKLITNTSPLLSPVIQVAGGYFRPILASGNFLGVPLLKRIQLQV